MKPLIKKTGAFLLLLLAALPLFYMLALQGYQRIVQLKMKRELEAGKLTTVTLKADKVYWVKKGKEITVGDKMFDVKKAVSNNDGTVTFTGLFDDEETIVKLLLKKAQEENKSKSSGQMLQLFRILQSLPENAYSNNCMALALPVKKYFISEISFPPSPYISIPTPPPLG